MMVAYAARQATDDHTLLTARTDTVELAESAEQAGYVAITHRAVT